MKKEYAFLGKCIWCLKDKSETSFNTIPHTISRHLLPSHEGVDVCDSCNSLFGTSKKNYLMSIDLATKEILNLIFHLHKLDNGEILSSTYFNLFKGEGRLEIKKSFKSNATIRKNLLRQYKKGLYAYFLQEYHLHIHNGLDDRFNKIRDFVRFDKGDLPVYSVMGKELFLVQDNKDFVLKFGDSILNEIENFGVYTIYLFGEIYFLKVIDKPDEIIHGFLNDFNNKTNSARFFSKGISELLTIEDIDYTRRGLFE